MIPLYADPFFTFRFADDRVVPRFHLEGVPSGGSVSIHRADASTLQSLGLLAWSTIGEGGWVELERPIIVRSGEVFVVYTH